MIEAHSPTRESTEPFAASSASEPLVREESVRAFVLHRRDHAAACFWGAVLSGVLPFLVKYCAAMWNQDLYQYFPFLLAAVFGLAYSRFDHRLSLPNGFWACFAIVLAVGFLVPAAALQSSWLGAIGFILLTYSFLASQTGRDGRSLAYLAIPMLMFLRAPLLATYTVMNRLQLITTDMSSIFLDVAGVLHNQSTNTIELVSKNLFVAEACSGVQSLFTVCFLSLVLLVYRRRSLAVVPVYLVFAFLFAIAGNVIRVTAIALAEEWFRVDITTGFHHEVVGYLCLAIAAGMLVSFDHLIGLVPGLTPRRQQNVAAATPVLGARETNEPAEFSVARSVRDFNRFQLISSGLAIACGLAMVVRYSMSEPDIRPVVATDKVLFEPSPSFLSSVNAPLRVVSHEVNRDAHGNRNARHGMNSDVWTCGIGSQSGQFVLSQPYMGWHELTICYKVQGWKMTSRATVAVAGEREPVVVADFDSEDGVHGCLVFSGVNSNGKLPRTPGHSPYSRVLSPIYPLVMDDFAETSGSAQTLMLQYWMIQPQPFDASAKQAAVDAMVKIRRRIAEDIGQKFQDALSQG
ncbi:Transmembrane exosortase [Rubripirellula tenax]|uniref:Transmembrane exosortase n=1 Tax=Rubripirellula tenax TaxID=2528015 RepID=A0A5C6EFM6_9BACT|nr:exosortase U [Rubripirellula tenax]TWU47578.1 Transmembrane exosortase [Rubripirellula tenax]